MNEAIALALAGAAGGVLGMIFFGGLWWTVGKVVSSEQPAPWLLASLMARMAIALVGFYFVSGGHWERLTACLVGFVFARLLVTWLTQTPAEGRSRRQAREATHAP